MASFVIHSYEHDSPVNFYRAVPGCEAAFREG